MKRTRTISIDDGQHAIAVTVKINSRSGLTRDEVARMMGRVSDGVMSTLAVTPFMSVYMSDIRVK